MSYEKERRAKQKWQDMLFAMDDIAQPTPAVAMLSRNAERARQMNEESKFDG